MPTAPLLFMLYGWGSVPEPPPSPASGGGGSGAFWYQRRHHDVVDTVRDSGAIDDSVFWKPEADIVRSHVEETLEQAGVDPRNEEAQALILYLLAMQVRRDSRSGALVVRPKRPGDPWIPLKEWLKDPKRWDDAAPDVVWDVPNGSGLPTGDELVESVDEPTDVPKAAFGAETQADHPLWPLIQYGLLFAAGYAWWTMLPHEEPVPVKIPVEDKPKRKRK